MTLKLAKSIACTVALSAGAANAQSQDDGARQIVLDQFTKARPTQSATKPPPKTPIKTPANPQAKTPPPPRRPKPAVTVKAPRYTRKSPAVLTASPSIATTSEIGVTIWRLRPAIGDDGSARVLVMENAQRTEWTPQRIEADTPLKVGERVRISIESPRAGYLYVVDREQNADGSFGDPYLIFPTLRTRGGDNQVRAGKLIDIPAQEDNPSYFTLIPTLGRGDQVAEVLSIIVTSAPLNLPITDKPLMISRSDVEAWEKAWSSRTERFEMDGGAGKSWTTVEMEASAKGSSRLLTQEEPTPQTIYRLSSKDKNTIMITVPLRYSR